MNLENGLIHLLYCISEPTWATKDDNTLNITAYDSFCNAIIQAYKRNHKSEIN